MQKIKFHKGETPNDFFTKMRQTSLNLMNQTESITNIIKTLEFCRQNGKQIYIIGNGGSAGTATHMACDLFKIAGIKTQSLCENVPLLTALTNDNGWSDVYLDQLKILFKKGDILIAISVHGCKGSDKAGKWSDNLLKAIEYANHNGTTIGLSGFDGGIFPEKCHINITVPAYSTPLVETFHMALVHLITFSLQNGERI